MVPLQPGCHRERSASDHPGHATASSGRVRAFVPFAHPRSHPSRLPRRQDTNRSEHTMTTLALHTCPEDTGSATEPGPKSPLPKRHLHLVPSAAPTSRGVPQAAQQAACAAARGIIEAVAGLRPVVHLAQSCDLVTYEKLRRRVRWECESQDRRSPAPSSRQAVGRQPGRPRLRLLSTHTQMVADGVEGSTTFGLGGRVRALGFRLESQRGRWRVVALELG